MAAKSGSFDFVSSIRACPRKTGSAFYSLKANIETESIERDFHCKIFVFETFAVRLLLPDTQRWPDAINLAISPDIFDITLIHCSTVRQSRRYWRTLMK